VTVDLKTGTSLLETFVGQLDDTDTALNTLGFVDDPRDGVVLRDSIIGHLMAVFMPHAAIETAKEITLEDNYHDADNIMRLILNLRPIIKTIIGKEDIKPFVKTIINSGALMIEVPETTTFENSPIVASGKVVVRFNPADVTFADGSHLTGEPTSLTLEFNRSTPEAKLQFTKLA